MNFFSTPVIYYPFQALFCLIGVSLCVSMIAALVIGVQYGRTAFSKMGNEFKSVRVRGRVQSLEDEKVINKMEMDRVMERKQLSHARRDVELIE